jgi:hypothetical protein
MAGRKNLVDREEIKRNARRFDGLRPFGHTHDAVERFRDHELDNTANADLLNLQFGALDAARGEHGKQSIVTRILIAADAQFLAAKILDFLDVGGLTRHQLEQGSLTEHGDPSERQSVGPNDH